MTPLRSHSPANPRARVALRSGVIAVLLGAALAALPGAAMARAAGPVAVTLTSPLTRGAGYVALGDSVTFGYQESAVVPAPDYAKPASFLGYPEQVGQALHVAVANFGCPGETSASLIDATAPSNGCENAYRRAFPLHVRYRGAQLAAAVAYLKAHRGVRLVSLMIGANDLFRCQAATGDACTSELPATLATIGGHVRHILSAIRRQAGYTGQLVILNYYSLDYSAPAVSRFSLALNRAQDTAARPFHVRVADGFGALRAASLRFGSNPCLAGLITQLGAYGNCGVHPSFAGQTLLAKAVIAAARLS